MKKGYSFEKKKIRKGFFFGEKKTRSGFTLIEILMVIGIFGVVVALGVSMFFSLLKGATKARIMAEVKQNGDYALNVMERMIRNAKEVTDPVTDGTFTEITILNPDNNLTTFSCSDNTIASNSASFSANLINDQVEVVDCSSFLRVIKGQTDLTADEVVISFTLKQTGSGGRPEEEALIDFSSTVILRNIVRE